METDQLPFHKSYLKRRFKCHNYRHHMSPKISKITLSIKELNSILIAGELRFSCVKFQRVSRKLSVYFVNTTK